MFFLSSSECWIRSSAISLSRSLAIRFPNTYATPISVSLPNHHHHVCHHQMFESSSSASLKSLKQIFDDAFAIPLFERSTHQHHLIVSNCQCHQMGCSNQCKRPVCARKMIKLSKTTTADFHSSHLRFKTFRCNLIHFNAFWYILLHFDAFQCILTHFDVFCCWVVDL